MKRLFIACALLSATSMLLAQTTESLVFTTILSNPITPVKNQSRSGTCWDYATIGFVEAELLRTTGRMYDLSEMLWQTRTTWTAPSTTCACMAAAGFRKAARLTTCLPCLTVTASAPRPRWPVPDR